MNKYESLKIQEFDHIEFAVADIEKASALYLKMGFEKAGSREISERKLKSFVMVQGGINVVLSQSSLDSDPVAQFVAKHGDGVCTVAFRCEDSFSTLEKTLHRGATSVEAPQSVQKDFGQVQWASIAAFGSVRHKFITRKGNLFLDGFSTPVKLQNRGHGLTRIDHITCNVEEGKLDSWSKYYEDIFGMVNTRYFDIHTQRSGLYSKVMQSPDGVIKMPVNEPAEGAGQIQEYIDVNHGPGVQHIALLTDGIVDSLKQLRASGIKFLDVPDTYYDAVPSRVPNITEDMNVLQKLKILADGSAKGYLLQIFTENLVGPFFYEVIQRKGDDGFGEGNFKALFEAIERDQIKRGTLKA